MEMRLDVLLLLLAAGAVTIVPRILPLLVFSKLQIPDWGLKWLNYIPIAILAALLAQVYMYETMQWDYLIAAIPTFLVAIYTRSLLGTGINGSDCDYFVTFPFLKGLHSYHSEKCNNMKNIGVVL